MALSILDLITPLYRYAISEALSNAFFLAIPLDLTVIKAIVRENVIKTTEQMMISIFAFNFKWLTILYPYI